MRVTHNIGYETNRIPSGFWANFPYAAAAAGTQNVLLMRDDFETFYADDNRYNLVGDSVTIAVAGDTGHVVATVTNTDNNESYLAGGIGLTGCCKMTTGGVSRVWWEVRTKVSVITDQGVFVGLALPTFVAANMLTDDTGETSTTNGSLVGFRVLTADPDGLDAIYGTAAAAATVYREAEATDSLYVPGSSTVYLQNAVADTYVKLGGYFDGAKHFWFVNGMKIDAAGVAGTATNFPDAVNMHICLGVKTGAAVAKSLTTDWWQIGYEIAG